MGVNLYCPTDLKCFHSINVPSEWGLTDVTFCPHVHQVSIQLMSPASGDWYRFNDNMEVTESFHSINVPSEWGQNCAN